MHFSIDFYYYYSQFLAKRVIKFVPEIIDSNFRCSENHVSIFESIYLFLGKFHTKAWQLQKSIFWIQLLVSLLRVNNSINFFQCISKKLQPYARDASAQLMFLNWERKLISITQEEMWLMQNLRNIFKISLVNGIPI